MDFLSNIADVKVVEAPASAGTSDLNSDGVDMAGYDGVLFIAQVTTAASAVTSLIAEQSSDDGSVDTYAAISGASASIPADTAGVVAVVDVFQPRERYVRATLDRETANATLLSGIIAIPYRANSRPITSSADVLVQVRDAAEA